MKRLFSRLGLGLLCISLLTGCAAPHRVLVSQAGAVGAPATLPPSSQVALKPTPTPQPTPTSTPAPTPTPLPQASPTPVLPVEPPIQPGEKVAYLTFDDGPSKNTPVILSVLAEKGVKATFFLIGNKAEKNPNFTRQIRDEGHLVANHTYSHDTSAIYQSLDALLENMALCAQVIKDLLGEDYPTDLFRFPTGSTNRRCRDYRQGVKEAGYRFFDWNALNGDAETGTYKRTPEELLTRLKDTVNTAAKGHNEIIILMHDTNSKENTPKMLGDAIDFLVGEGYSFRTLQDKQMDS